MKKPFNHESTKQRKHERIEKNFVLSKFRVFVINPFGFAASVEIGLEIEITL